MRRLVVLVIAGASLVGCANIGIEPNGTADDVFGVQAGGKPSLNYFYDAVMPAGLAQVVAEGCPRLTYSTYQHNRMSERVAKRMIADGYTELQLHAIINNLESNEAFDARITADGIAFAERHGLVGRDPETFCAAGRAEISAGSDVGKFLKGTG